MYQFVALEGEAQILNDWCSNFQNLLSHTLGIASSFGNGWNWNCDSDKEVYF